jgi:hypothetical protein
MAEQYIYKHWCFHRDTATNIQLCQDRQEEDFDDCATCSGPEPKIANEIKDLQDRLALPTIELKRNPEMKFYSPPPREIRKTTPTPPQNSNLPPAPPQDHDPSPAAPKTCIICTGPIKGFGKTGMCKSCSCRVNAKKAKTPQAKAKQAAAHKKTVALKNNQHPPTAHQKLQQKDPTTPPSSPPPADIKTKATRKDNRLYVDFTNHEELLIRLKSHAKKMFRTQNSQALFIISEYFNKFDRK